MGGGTTPLGLNGHFIMDVLPQFDDPDELKLKLKNIFLTKSQVKIIHLLTLDRTLFKIEKVEKSEEMSSSP